MQSVCHRVRSIRQGLAGRAETHVSTVRDTDVWKSVLVAVRDDATALPFPVSPVTRASCIFITADATFFAAIDKKIIRP